jgi:hypothetical protein
MPRDETSDVVLAFLIGAALGVGATLLMRSDDRFEARRVLQDLGVMRRRSRLDSAREAGEDMVNVGRRAVANVREEAAEIVSAARDELLHAARRTLKEARRAAARGRGS